MRLHSRDEYKKEAEYLWDWLAWEVVEWWEEERYNDDPIQVAAHFLLRVSTTRIVTERAKLFWKDIYLEEESK
jgi:hypothetical protein